METNNSKNVVNDSENVVNVSAENVAPSGERFSNLFSAEEESQVEDNSQDPWYKRVYNYLSDTATAVEQDYQKKIDSDQAGFFDMPQFPHAMFKKHYEVVGGERTDYINSITDGNYSPNANTLDEYIDSDFKFQGTLGFADTREEVEKALKIYLNPMPDGSDREFKIVMDDRKDKPFYMPTYYTSVEKDDGTFTKYSNPLQSVSDYVARLTPQTLYGVASGVTEVGTAATTAAAAGILTGLTGVGLPLAPVVAGTVFLTSLYANAVSSERVREDFVKGKLGLTEEESVEWMRFFEVVKSVQENHPLINTGKQMLGYEITPTARNAQEKFAGYISAFGTPIARVFDRLGLLGDRLRRQTLGTEELKSLPEAGISTTTGKIVKPNKDGKFDEDVEVYMKGGMKIPLFKQVMRATQDAQMFRKGGAFAHLGVPFDHFMLATFTPAKFIERISKLAQQTSLILPSRLKKQAKQLMDITQAYARGEPIDYAAFRAPYLELRNAHKNMGDALRKDYDGLARQIGGVDNLFGAFRMLDAKLQYNEVFKTIGNSSYNLSPLQKSILKVLNERRYAAGATKGKKPRDSRVTLIEVTDPNARSYDLDRIINELKELGKESTGGVRMLNAQQARKAKKMFLDKNSDFLPKGMQQEFMRTAPGAITPANMLHGYAVILNQLIYSPKLAGPAKEAARAEATALRKTLLDMLGSPELSKNLTKEQLANIKPLLDSANKFYRETFRLRGKSANSASDLQRIRDEIENDGDPGVVLNDILGDGIGTPPKRGKVVALKSIKEQIDYIKKEGDRLVKQANEFDYSKNMFDETGSVSDVFKDMRKTFHSYLYRSLGYNIGIRKTDPKNLTAFTTFFDRIDDDVLELMGISKDKKQYFLETAEDYATIFDDTFMKELNKAMPQEQVYDFIDQMFKGADFDSQLRRLIYPQEDVGVALGKGMDKSKIRDAIFQYMFDPRGNAGALRRQTTNTAYFDANEHYIDINALSNIMDKIESSKVLQEKGIFSETDMKFLRAVKNMGMALEGSTKTDAGIALSGAQIFSDVVEVWNLYKFFGAITRIAMQGRISNVLASKKTVNFIAGINENKPKGFLRRAFFGKGALSDILAEFAIITPSRIEEPEVETEEPGIDMDFDKQKRFKNLFEQSGINAQTNRLLSS